MHKKVYKELLFEHYIEDDSVMGRIGIRKNSNDNITYLCFLELPPKGFERYLKYTKEEFLEIMKKENQFSLTSKKFGRLGDGTKRRGCTLESCINRLEKEFDDLCQGKIDWKHNEFLWEEAQNLMNQTHKKFQEFFENRISCVSYYIGDVYLDLSDIRSTISNFYIRNYCFDRSKLENKLWKLRNSNIRLKKDLYRKIKISEFKDLEYIDLTKYISNMERMFLELETFPHEPDEEFFTLMIYMAKIANSYVEDLKTLVLRLEQKYR